MNPELENTSVIFDLSKQSELLEKALKLSQQELDEKTKSEIEIPKKNNTPKAFVIHPEGRSRINIE